MSLVLCSLPGGTASDSMKKSANLLIVGGNVETKPTLKLVKARELGVEVWTEKQWISFMKKSQICK